VQWAEFSARGDGLVGGLGVAQCVLGEQGDDGVDLRVDLGDAVQVGLDDFARGHLLGGDQCRQGGCVLVVQRGRILAGD
jgi:hypothetical protein